MEFVNLTFETRVIVALCLVVILVIGINAVLFFALRNTSTTRHVQLWQKAAKRARDPWKEEDEALNNLSKLVSQFRDEQETVEDETS
jgi:sensor histidine kinase regulating citrate/malate metabolism